jgi:creatinine amidohydrolase/Fe(II)-dependent formamide hydrolase-like protein
MPYSACPGKTQGYPGTVVIRPELALGYLSDVLEGILRAGFVRVLLLNAHDANMSIARAAMEWVSGKYRSSLLLVNWWQLVTPAETAAQAMFTGHSGRGHGGPYETAVTWAFAPDAVEIDAAAELTPRPNLETDRPYVLVESCPSPWEGYSGLIRQATREKGLEVITGTFPYAANGRALAEGEGAGLVKTVADRQSGRLLGVTILGEHGAELIGQACVALGMGATVHDLERIIIPHPTYSEMFKESALAAQGLALHIIS